MAETDACRKTRKVRKEEVREGGDRCSLWSDQAFGSYAGRFKEQHEIFANGRESKRDETGRGTPTIANTIRFTDRRCSVEK